VNDIIHVATLEQLLHKYLQSVTSLTQDSVVVWLIVTPIHYCMSTLSSADRSSYTLL